MARTTLKTTLPTPPKDIEDNLLTFLNHLVTIVSDNFKQLARADATGWLPQNVPTGNRDLDADTASLDETRKTVTRLIEDLKDAGVLAG